MSSIEYGFRRAVLDIIGGIFLGSLLTIISSMWLDQSWVLFFEIFIALSSIGLILKMRYWGTGYLVGWLLGLIIMAQANLVSFSDILIFFGALLILIVRIYRSSD